MSVARQRFIEDIAALTEAVALDPLAQGASGLVDSRGVVILRRGMLITSLIALETFVRERTVEILDQLSTWPATYQQLPAKLREAALLEALPNLQRYAKMLKRQEEDYEAVLLDQINKMSMTSGPVFGFSKFVSGDFTGNLSDSSLKDLLSCFQIKDCWNTFRHLSADAGIGVPSVHEIVKDIIRKRHRSAHSSDYVPSIDDIRNITQNLSCVGMCFDIAMTSSVKYALYDWQKWLEDNYSWRDHVIIYHVDKSKSKFKLKKLGQNRALRILNTEIEALAKITQPSRGCVAAIINRDEAARPVGWSIV